jgi:hypothetical protein
MAFRRYVPAGVRREVRQRCGFGCVLCGLGIYGYEHFDPDFKDAREHRAEGLTLLCMQCNQKRRRNHLSVETVRAANAGPKCLEQGFANDSFDFGQEPIEVKFAGVTFTGCEHLIAIGDTPLLSVSGPEGPRQAYRLSGRFHNAAGDSILTIDDNVWQGNGDNWDIECSGPRITIRNKPGDTALVLKSEPPTSLVVERLDMYFDGVFLHGQNDVLKHSFDGGRWTEWRGLQHRL